MLDEHRPEEWPLYEMATIIFFIVPMAVLVVLYVRIGIRIRNSGSIRGRETAPGPDGARQLSARRTVLRMLGKKKKKNLSNS